MPPTITIDVISDFTCVWCILCHHILHQTLSLFNKTHPSKPDFRITYRPYYLHRHSSLPIPALTHAVPKASISAVKLAGMSDEKVKRMRQKIDSMGRAVGVVFKEGELIGPTRDAHALVHVARSRGQQMQVDLYGRLLSLYHERGEDISDRDLLAREALAVGLGEQEIAEAWNEKTCLEVDEDEEYWRGVAGGHGVPVVMIEGPQGKERIDGCPDGGSLYEIFIKVLVGPDAFEA